MAAQKDTRDAGIGASFFISTVIHLAVFLLLFWWNALFPVTMAVETTYYVDVVNLPVASPQAGNPAQQEKAVEAPPPPLPIKSMSLPAPPAKPHAKSLPVKTSKTPDKSRASDESQAFTEKLAKLAKTAESRQQEETLERLRRKVAASENGKSGAPGGGNQAGSDYLNYITSRISEVFSEPPNTSRDIFAVIRIKINGSGKVDLLKITRSSGDIAFDNYAVKSIYEAEKKFQPPPAGSFEFSFRFRPQGISNR